MSPSRPTLLTLRALGLGDLLTAIPALRALRRAYPRHRHVLAAPEALRPLVLATGAVDELLPTAGLGPVRWDGPSPSVACNLHGRGPESHEMLEAVRPGRLLAFRRDAAGSVPDPDSATWDPDEHEVDRWCRMLRAYGLDADPRDVDLVPPPGPLDDQLVGATVIHPGAASASRRWPTDRFAAVAASEWAAGRTVVITGTSAERDLALDVATRAGLPVSAVLSGRTNLGTLARVVSAAGLVVCGDTGVGHLATAVGTPSVLLFGPTSPDRWGPPKCSRHHVLWHGSLGDPHAPSVDPGLLSISAAEVLAAIRSIRRAAAHGSGTDGGIPEIAAASD
ncbi:MAG: glycosyltransferase family 9 protein [Actinomycetia bacterium]|nr:glycosyltransferase family 9 protein [Actinomycetes bacterium]